MRRLALVLLIAAAWAASARAHDAANAQVATAGLSVSTQARYTVPAARVVDTRGRSMRLPGPLDTDTPQIVNFIYTTCSTICSTQTATLAELQRLLAAHGERARFTSFTIDPDNDTPQRLAEFARRFDIDRDWDFYSGDFDELLRVQQAFDVYRGSKASHPPVVLMRRSRAAPWVRVEGFATANELLAVYRRLPAQR
ncbi:MAG: SCO family protein [Burkholderiaceae bacterium]